MQAQFKSESFRDLGLQPERHIMIAIRGVVPQLVTAIQSQRAVVVAAPTSVTVAYLPSDVCTVPITIKHSAPPSTTAVDSVHGHAHQA